VKLMLATVYKDVPFPSEEVADDADVTASLSP
jgi:hypothetical protein